jgi:hypothetical protein
MLAAGDGSRPSVAAREAMLYRAHPVQQSIAEPAEEDGMRRRLSRGSMEYWSA